MSDDFTSRNDWILDSSEFDPNSNKIKENKAPISHSSQIFDDPLKKSIEDSNINIDLKKNWDFVEHANANVLVKSRVSKPATLSAESLKIFSKINIDNLAFNSKFDLLFNDLSMLKATAVQGLLGNTNFRFLSWMIFLECIPMEKSSWTNSIQKNRTFYNQIKSDLACDPHCSSAVLDEKFDHPLSQHKTVIYYLFTLIAQFNL